MVSGTFSDTGQSDSITADHMSILLSFAGTASVDIQVQMPSGTWVKKGSSLTANYFESFDNSGRLPVRLNCTAHTNDVEYALVPGTGSRADVTAAA